MPRVWLEYLELLMQQVMLRACLNPSACIWTCHASRTLPSADPAQLPGASTPAQGAQRLSPPARCRCFRCVSVSTTNRAARQPGAVRWHDVADQLLQMCRGQQCQQQARISLLPIPQSRNVYTTPSCAHPAASRTLPTCQAYRMPTARPRRFAQVLLTRTRRVFDRALAALPITQHGRVWALYLVHPSWLPLRLCPPSTPP
jgi:hypothetical protein